MTTPREPGPPRDTGPLAGMDPEDRRVLTVALAIVAGGFFAGLLLLFAFFATGL